MRKMTTFFKKDLSNPSRVVDEIDPANAWALLSSTVATRKYDGTACAVVNGKLYKRYDAKKGKPIPKGAIPCQDPDPITGHHPHWVQCDRENKADKYFWEAWDKPDWFFFVDGTYELCGEKIQGNPEKIRGHKLIPHGAYALDLVDKSFDGIKAFLAPRDIEGIVFHGDNGQMCKIRKRDFGMKR